MVFIWYLHKSYNGRKAKKHGLRFACESSNDNAFSCSFRKDNKKSSYENRNCLILNVAGPGHDPGTSGLWIRRSNQLSYPANTQFRLSHYCSNWIAGAKVSIIFEFCKFFPVFFLQQRHLAWVREKEGNIFICFIRKNQSITFPLLLRNTKEKKNRKSAIISQASYFVSLQKEYIQIDRQNNHNDNQRP